MHCFLKAIGRTVYSSGPHTKIQTTQGEPVRILLFISDQLSHIINMYIDNCRVRRITQGGSLYIPQGDETDTSKLVLMVMAMHSPLRTNLEML